MPIYHNLASALTDKNIKYICGYVVFPNNINCGDFSVFLRAFVNELWLTKKKKGQNEDSCS